MRYPCTLRKRWPLQEPWVTVGGASDRMAHLSWTGGELPDGGGDFVKSTGDFVKSASGAGDGEGVGAGMYDPT